MTTPTLRVEGLTVVYEQEGRSLEALREVDLSILPGQTYGLVGESGSGKSTLALAVMRYLSENGSVTEGSISLSGENLLSLSQQDMRSVWQSKLSLVPQNPLPSMNPAHTVGKQVAEALNSRHGDGTLKARDRVMELFASVGLADPERVAKSYPHQLSGGMQQRVMIAMALGSEPDLLILDEPTTNLDVTTEATILDLVRELIRQRDTAVLYVSHSLGVVAQVCDRVAVLYAGELVEDAPVKELFRKPLHPYTQGLLDSVPKIGQDKTQLSLRPIEGHIPELDALPSGCIFTPRCPVAVPLCSQLRPALEVVGPERHSRCHRWEEIAAGSLSPRQEVATAAQSYAEAGEEVLRVEGFEKTFRVPRSLLAALRGLPPKRVHAVDGVDFTIARNRTLGLVGESGSGKSTLSRCVVGLYEPTNGKMDLLDLPLAPKVALRDKDTLRQLQMVFQSSEEALNPYLTVGETLRRPLKRLAGLNSSEAEARMHSLLESVKLSPAYATRLPAQLSGGERQRVAIARAFASQPELLIFDESVSGLDVSVQAAIVNLLGELQAERQAAYLFISHDLAVVSYLADEVAVMYLGHLMEHARSADVLKPPYHPYTEALLASIPLIDPEGEQVELRLSDEVPSPTEIPSGCRFHTRCPRFLGDICVNEEPPWREDAEGNRIYCHIPLDELKKLQRDVFRFSDTGRDDG